MNQCGLIPHSHERMVRYRHNSSLFSSRIWNLWQLTIFGLSFCTHFISWSILIGLQRFCSGFMVSDSVDAVLLLVYSLRRLLYDVCS